MSKNLIIQVIDGVVDLACFHEIWWQLLSRDNEEKYKENCERYDDFFSSVIRSHELSIIVIIRRLFDDRRDVASIVSLQKSLPGHHAELAAEIASNIAEKQSAISKITSLRHKVHAHRDKSIEPEVIYRNEAITPNEILSVVRLAQQCVASLAEAFGERDREVFLQGLELTVASTNRDLERLMIALGKAGSDRYEDD